MVNTVYPVVILIRFRKLVSSPSFSTCGCIRRQTSKGDTTETPPHSPIPMPLCDELIPLIHSFKREVFTAEKSLHEAYEITDKMEQVCLQAKKRSEEAGPSAP